MTEKKQTKEDKAKEREGLETLLKNTEDAYYSAIQKSKFYKSGSQEGRENAYLVASNYYDKNPQEAAAALKQQGHDEIYGGNSNKVGLWDLVDKHSQQHLLSLSKFNVSDIVNRISENSGYKKEKIEELAPSIKKYYDKPLAELMNNEETGEDFGVIMNLYNLSIEAKKAKEVAQLKMDNFLQGYYTQNKQKAEQAQKAKQGEQ